MYKVKFFKADNMSTLNDYVNKFIADKIVVNVSFSMYHKIFEWYGASVLYKDDLFL